MTSQLSGQLVLQLSLAWGVTPATVERHDRLLNAVASSPPPEMHAALRQDLFYSDNAWLLATHRHDARLENPTEQLEAFLNTLSDGASEAELARIDWVRSRVASQLGDYARMNERLTAALDNDPTFDLAADDFLWVSAASGDRKELAGALAEWIDAADEDLLDGLREPTTQEALRLGLQSMYATAPVRGAVSVGRNEPCPCESGKKYKACHLGKALPGDDGWSGVTDQEFTALNSLYLLFVDRMYPHVLRDLVHRVERKMTPMETTMLCLFALDCEAANRNESDGFVDSLRECGWNLSTEAELLVRATTESPMCAYEVTTRTLGVSLTLRDLLSDAVVVSYGTESSRQFEVGDLLLARVIGPDGRNRLGQGALGLTQSNLAETLQWLKEAEGRPTAREIVHRCLDGF